jgi:hypothetical protein
MAQNTIGWAVKQMQNGELVCRSGWNGKHMWIAIGQPDDSPHKSNRLSLPYVYMMTAQHQTVPWLCSQTDLLATDWELYEHG